MGIFKAFIINLALILIFAISLTAQSTSISDSRARLINRQAFYDEKNGIKDFIKIYDKLEEEFKPQNQELRLLAQEYKKLQNEMSQILAKRLICRPDAEAYNKKKNDSELLMSKIEIQQNTVKLLYEKRETFLSEKINENILIALKQFAKENDYSAIVDISEVDLPCGNGFCVCLNLDIDITKEFIQFYNSKTEKK